MHALNSCSRTNTSPTLPHSISTRTLLCPRDADPRLFTNSRVLSEPHATEPRIVIWCRDRLCRSVSHSFHHSSSTLPGDDSITKHENYYSDLSRFISSGRLNCTIDRVHGVVETNRPSSKNSQYENLVRQGDMLLNSVQRLSRVLY